MTHATTTIRKRHVTTWAKSSRRRAKTLNASPCAIPYAYYSSTCPSCLTRCRPRMWPSCWARFWRKNCPSKENWASLRSDPSTGSLDKAKTNWNNKKTAATEGDLLFTQFHILKLTQTTFHYTKKSLMTYINKKKIVSNFYLLYYF